MQVVLVAVAGALGTLSRYGLGRAVGTTDFPWTTLAINLAGSFALGVVVKGAVEHGWSTTTTATIGTGFLGGFTTFSAFSVETHTLLRDGRTGAAAFYVGLSVVGGIAAAALGYAAARAWS
jgi:fluoride exporter